ncbi:OmpA family protein [Bacillus sp. UNCCL81]|uniref:OmpA/MotB family protein n=1 Tax=Bacillus sp. UNCCL81 TaxID=1502755 RepID=UPI0008EA6FA8|nr:OmpA family protein [Bacillus sp. UNCCL81]SFC95278.1 chemotaxis protein MotB [Bacillus sp. UNCCL81]
MARGFRNIRRYPSVGHEEEKESFWVSYTDLMSGLVIIFALVLMIAMFTMQDSFEKSQKTIKEKNKVIEDIVGVKTKLIDQLVKEFDNSNLQLQVDPNTGAIRFSGGVFFASDSTEITPQGRKYLEEFIPKYVDILMSKEFKNEVSQIIVEGHTDKQGTYLYNLNLSQGRALSVVQEIYSPDFPKFKHQQELSSIITANGRSYSVPIKGKNGQIDPNKSRRVEFKFRLKDDQVIEKINEMVKANER